MSAVVIQGDARDLGFLKDESADLVVTSPPYFSLRNYRDRGASLTGQIGAEATPQEYIANLIQVTRECLRVLKPSGGMFVILGDTYYSAKGAPTRADAKSAARRGWDRAADRPGLPWQRKTLMCLPERYRIACMDELGVVVRQVIEWHKPNATPESVRDRCQRVHEDIVHLVKQPTYYSAVDGIREPHARIWVPGRNGGRTAALAGTGSRYDGMPGSAPHLLGALPASVWHIPSCPFRPPERFTHLECCGGRKRPGCQDGLEHWAAFPSALIRKIILGWSAPGICTACGEGRFPVSDRRVTSTQCTTESRSSMSRGTAAIRGINRKALELIPRGYDMTITGWACACTPYTDHLGTKPKSRRRDYNRSQNARPQGTYGRHQAGEYQRTGPWREYHLDRWDPPPVRPAVVVDPFNGAGTAPPWSPTSSAAMRSVSNSAAVTATLPAGGSATRASEPACSGWTSQHPWVTASTNCGRRGLPRERISVAPDRRGARITEYADEKKATSMIQETYKGRKLKVTKDGRTGGLVGSINNQPMPTGYGVTEQELIEQLHRDINLVDQAPVDGGRWGAYMYAPGTYELCQNNHPKTPGKPCKHSCCQETANA